MTKRKRYIKRRIERRINRTKFQIKRLFRALGRAVAWTARLLIPLVGVGSICYAAFLNSLALGFLVTGVVLLIIDWWIENQ
jgi:hypothetical protein